MGMCAFKPGETLDDKYHINNIVGAGGMGTVVRAERLGDKQIVAIKYCHKKDEISHRRFGREVRIAKGIEHTHVIEVLDEQLDHDPPYFVMPYAKSSLEKKLDDLSKSEDDALDAFRQLCAGVQAIHNSRAIHRDIKPANCLILEDGTVVLADLGLAKHIERNTTILTNERHVLGTEIYFAPEQRIVGGSRDADERTDIFQLGKTLYELVTGRSPGLIDPSALPVGLSHVVRRATRELPDERYQTVGELLDAVKIYQDAKVNPLLAYEAVITRIQEGITRNEYTKTDVIDALQILTQEQMQGSAESYLELVDSLPEEILPTAATLASVELRPILEAYVKALDDAVGEARSFAYAELVARRMRIVYQETNDVVVRTMALEAVLIASVRLNRFAAMSVFDQMLLQVTNDADAYPIRDMLAQRKQEYRVMYDRIPPLKLHPVIKGLADQHKEENELS